MTSGPPTARPSIIWTTRRRPRPEESRDAYQAALDKAGRGRITTEITEAQPYYYAEDYHQGYLAKNPAGYCGIGGTGRGLPDRHRRDGARVRKRLIMDPGRDRQGLPGPARRHAGTIRSGDDPDVYKVGGKMFVMAGGEGGVSFKVSDIAYESADGGGAGAAGALYGARAKWGEPAGPPPPGPMTNWPTIWPSPHAIIAAKLTKKQKSGARGRLTTRFARIQKTRFSVHLGGEAGMTFRSFITIGACAVALGSCQQAQLKAPADAPAHVVAASDIEAGSLSDPDRRPATTAIPPTIRRLAGGSPRRIGSRAPGRASWGRGGTTYPHNLRRTVAGMTEDAWVEMLNTREGLPPMPWPSVRAMAETDKRAVYRYIKSLPLEGDPAPTALPPGQKPTTPYENMMPVMPGA